MVGWTPPFSNTTTTPIILHSHVNINPDDTTAGASEKIHIMK